MALSYLEEMPLAEATARMRTSLLRFTAHHGVNVYHETLTTFWVRLLAHVVSRYYSDLPLWRRINMIVNRWGTASIVNRIHNAEKTVQAAQERMAKSGNTKNSNNVDPSKVTQTPPPMTYKPGP